MISRDKRRRINPLRPYRHVWRLSRKHGRCLALVATLAMAPAAAGPTYVPLTIGTRERLLVLAPHPDDEVLSSGGLMQTVLARGGTVRIVIATAGDAFVEAVERDTGQPHPRPADYIRYGELRLKEATRVADVLGHGEIRLDMLGFPDGGLHPLLVQHWNRRHPERSPTTGLNQVAYPEAEHRHVPFDGADLRNELLHILEAQQPTLIVFPDAMDWHPDHDGLGMFALLAIDDWLKRDTRPHRPKPPRLLAYLVHWYHDWPAGSTAGQSVDMNDQPLNLPDDLPRRGHERSCLALDPDQRAFKRQLLAIYQTQQRAMAPFLAAFVRATECFSVLQETDAEHIEEWLERRHRH